MGPVTEPSMDELIEACAREPIHTPGAIQPHGVLVVVGEDGAVQAVSANSDDVLDRPAEALLGQSASDALGIDQSALASLESEEVQAVDLPIGSFDAILRRRGEVTFVELEPAAAKDGAEQWQLFGALRAFHGATTVGELLDRTATVVRDLSGFDRVLVYRFDPDWNGEVVAEASGDDVVPFLGLRFPAADIPPQARALYSRARLRLIPDSGAVAVPLLARDDAVGSLDLSDVALRAVSPVHLLYLRNMGVRASMSIALMVDGELWGLVACHHLAGPIHPSLRTRAGLDLAARTASAVLGALLQAGAAQGRLELHRALDGITADLSHVGTREPAELLLERGDDLLRLFTASGVALIARGERAGHGVRPDDAVIDAVIEEARPAGVLVTESLSDLLGHGFDLEDVAGALAVRVGKGEERWMVWFRREESTTVRWGGDPRSKEVGVDERGTVRLTPRASFEEYVEQVRGRSHPWSAEEVEAAHALAARIGELQAARQDHQAELAAALQRAILLDRLPPIPEVESAAQYLPSAGQPLGGDWYDVFFRPRGASIVAIGDVAGHGLAAAATMTQLRHALRAYLVREDTIGDAMNRLNELMRTLVPTEFATATLVELDTEGRSANVINAGHLPPVVIDGDGARLLGDGQHRALGLAPGTAYSSTPVSLPHGSTLVLYTDGLIERRRTSLDDSLEELVAAAAPLAGRSCEEICEALVGAFAGGSDIDDDVTVVAVRFLDETAPRGDGGVRPGR